MQTRLISITPEAEKIILYCARGSNPKNQDSGDVNLLNYCVKHKHWSIFEQAYLTIEIQTSRAIAAQILRHRSFSFQEFSQRYAKVTECEFYPARRQDEKNRQNSIDDLDESIKNWFNTIQTETWHRQFSLYQQALDKGIAKEQARFLLPLSTATKLYMSGNIRSWIHYLLLRLSKETQKEHRDIAESIKNIFIKELPNLSKAVGWQV